MKEESCCCQLHAPSSAAEMAPLACAGTLAAPGLAAFQGPALLAFNDAVFSEADFQSISNIGNSVKRDQKGKDRALWDWLQLDLSPVRRALLHIRWVCMQSASYLLCLQRRDTSHTHIARLKATSPPLRPSLTDSACTTECMLPVAGSNLVIFDPHCEHLPGISAANPGKRIDFVATNAKAEFPDQFAPYCAFGCDAASYFPGTLFRFPLRTPEQAQRSRISKQVAPLWSLPPVTFRMRDTKPHEPCYLDSTERAIYRHVLRSMSRPLAWAAEGTDTKLHVHAGV